jgi:hypothetical protein
MEVDMSERANINEIVVVKILDSATPLVQDDTFDFQPEFTTESTGPAMGDFDNDGDVDGRDFLVWQRGSTADDGDASITDGTSNTVPGDGSVRFLQDGIDVYIYV